MSLLVGSSAAFSSSNCGGVTSIRALGFLAGGTRSSLLLESLAVELPEVELELELLLEDDELFRLRLLAGVEASGFGIAAVLVVVSTSLFNRADRLLVTVLLPSFIAKTTSLMGCRRLKTEQDACFFYTDNLLTAGAAFIALVKIFFGTWSCNGRFQFQINAIAMHELQLMYGFDITGVKFCT